MEQRSTKQAMLRGPFLSKLIHFFIRTDTDNDHCHGGFCAAELINNPQSGRTELDFHKPGKTCSTVIAQRLPIALLINRQRVLLNLFDCFQNKDSLTSI